MKVFVENNQLDTCDDSPYLGSYFLTYRKINLLKRGGQDYLLINDRPRFCSGHNCNFISVMLINLTKKNYSVTNTGFCEDKKLIKTIQKNLKHNKSLFLILDQDCNNYEKVSRKSPCNFQ
jgi:hypothetical protein